MRIVVNHLTRMGAKHFGAAGIDPGTGRHVRPVTEGDGLPVSLLARNGGPFDVAKIVDLGEPEHRPTQPHIEDHVVDASKVAARGAAEPDAFWRLLGWVTKARLRDIFGDALKRFGAAACGTDAGKGEASLGCLSPAGSPELYIESEARGKPRVRLKVSDGEFDVDLGVSDIRLYHTDLVTPDRDTVHKVSAEIRDSAAVILGVGLSKEFASGRRRRPVHWLQVTSIHLKEDPARHCHEDGPQQG